MERNRKFSDIHTDRHELESIRELKTISVALGPLNTFLVKLKLYFWQPLSISYDLTLSLDNIFIGAVKRLCTASCQEHNYVRLSANVTVIANTEQ